MKNPSLFFHFQEKDFRVLQISELIEYQSHHIPITKNIKNSRISSKVFDIKLLIP